MKGRNILSVVITSMAISASAWAYEMTLADPQTDEPGKITVSLSYKDPAISMDVNGKAVVSIAGLPNTIDAGYPSLPFETLKIALPPGAKFLSASFEPLSVVDLNIEIARSLAQIPLSWERSSGRSSDAPLPLDFVQGNYPTARADAFVQTLHGVPIVIVNVFPLVQKSGAAEFASNGILSVAFERGENFTDTSLRPHQADRVRSFVHNPRMIAKYRAASPQLVADGYEYLIVSNDDLIKYTGQWGFGDLQTGLSTRGLRSKVVSVTSINKEGTGADLQAKIRNFIRSEYQKFGIQYVLLAADADGSASSVIPVRRLNSKIRAYMNGHWEDEEQNIPADLYYSCLDNDFNGNGNDKWGEPTDGPSGADVDLLAEVVVGRMPMKTTAQLQNFVRKTLWMYSNKVAKSAFLLGEELFPEKDLYGDEYMDQLIGVCTDHNYRTSGFTPDWAFEKFYERHGSWSGDAALEKINTSSFSMVNHLGHSNTSYNMKLYSSFGTPNFKNPKPYFYYTQGCFPGDFTANDCFIEKVLRLQYGPVAAIANTNYGLGPEDPDPSSTKTPGASQMLNRQFINAVFTDHLTNLGRAHQNSKEDFIGFAKSQEIRWVFWDANFFGDPSVELNF